MNDKLDYWIMFVEGDITLETLTELLNDYVQRYENNKRIY